MYYSYAFLIALGVFQSLAATLPRADPEGKRNLPSCSHDNLYRIFLDARYSASASLFCSVYIESTSTATATSTPLYTTTDSVTTTITNFVTDTNTLITTVATISDTATITTTLTDDVTTAKTTITVTPPAAKKRAQSTVAPPGLAGTYPPSRLSSACSCLVTPSTVVQTVTTQGATSTVTKFVSVTVSTTATLSTELTVPATAVTTATLIVSKTDVVIVATATPTYYAPAAYCPARCLNNYRVQCGESYINVSSGFFVTTATYTACQQYCSKDGYCYGFSFVLGSTTNNCWITGDFYVLDGKPPLPDNGVNSGVNCAL